MEQKQLTTQELGSQHRCMCCGNNLVNRGIGMINSYWLQGKKFVYLICPECWSKKERQFIFLRMEDDLKKLKNRRHDIPPKPKGWSILTTMVEYKKHEFWECPYCNKEEEVW